MISAHAVTTRLVQAIVIVYRSGLASPGAYAHPGPDEAEGTAPSERPDAGSDHLAPGRAV